MKRNKKTDENKICYFCDKIVYIHGTSLICYELKLLKWIPAVKDVATAGLAQADITDIKKKHLSIRFLFGKLLFRERNTRKADKFGLMSGRELIQG